MSLLSEEFDCWIREEFVILNSQLEALYWQQAQRDAIEGIGEDIKAQLFSQGCGFIKQLCQEGNTGEGFANAFNLLGNVGLFLAACRRHNVFSEHTHTQWCDATTLAMHVGTSIGLNPRFATAHLTTHNQAQGGRYKRFTHLEDEALFIELNTRGIVYYQQAAFILMQCHPLGISHPLLPELLSQVKSSLMNVIKNNAQLFKQLDIQRFFYSVRPYYKPYKVGNVVYRGANAGDFAGINVLDLQLGLCLANDLEYGQLLIEKRHYMMPQEQTLLQQCLRLPSLLDLLLSNRQAKKQAWFQHVAHEFIAVCKVYGDCAIQHHNQLVDKFIEKPSKELTQSALDDVTASGPPLPVLLKSLEHLRDWRSAAQSQEISTRFEDLQLLRSWLE